MDDTSILYEYKIKEKLSEIYLIYILMTSFDHDDEKNKSSLYGWSNEVYSSPFTNTYIRYNAL